MTRLYRIVKSIAGNPQLHPAFVSPSKSTHITIEKKESRTPKHASSYEAPSIVHNYNRLQPPASFDSPSASTQTHIKKRIKTTYNDNYSAALSFPYSLQELQQKREDIKVLINLSKQQIIEHASRRVDLFLYTLISYYNTGYHPTLGRTVLQHGRGRPLDRYTNLTEACHSSFTPSLQDDFGEDNSDSLLADTHFKDSLNATVELPPFVNELDNLLEESCRTKSIEILGQVALGKLDPIEGLTRFLQMLQLALDELKAEGELQQKNSRLGFFEPTKHPIRLDVLELICKGSLAKTYSQSTRLASDEYLQLMLRLTPEEIEQCHKDEDLKTSIYAKKILELKMEILESKSTFDSDEFAKQMKGL